jgi:hypothetical protein
VPSTTLIEIMDVFTLGGNQFFWWEGMGVICSKVYLNIVNSYFKHFFLVVDLE